ncbi:DNA methylase [Ruminococcus sp. AF42-10]|nr:DNA methylase [Ruminococcus sp. AF42-10]
MRIGSAEIASKELNRNFIGIEIDKDYYNIAQERINNTKYNEVI